jgi:hypothetical protein
MELTEQEMHSINNHKAINIHEKKHYLSTLSWATPGSPCPVQCAQSTFLSLSPPFYPSLDTASLTPDKHSGMVLQTENICKYSVLGMNSKFLFWAASQVPCWLTLHGDVGGEEVVCVLLVSVVHDIM